jgi:putative membrane protein
MKQFLIIVGVILAPTIALAHFNNFNENGWGHHMGMNMLNGGGGFMMIIIYAVIIIFLFSFVKDLISRKSRHSESAIQIIKERFAKGEITQTEYQEMKKQVRT